MRHLTGCSGVELKVGLSLGKKKYDVVIFVFSCLILYRRAGILSRRKRNNSSWFHVACIDDGM